MVWCERRWKAALLFCHILAGGALWVVIGWGKGGSLPFSA